MSEETKATTKDVVAPVAEAKPVPQPVEAKPAPVAKVEAPAPVEAKPAPVAKVEAAPAKPVEAKPAAPVAKAEPVKPVVAAKPAPVKAEPIKVEPVKAVEAPKPTPVKPVEAIKSTPVKPVVEATPAPVVPVVEAKPVPAEPVAALKSAPVPPVAKRSYKPRVKKAVAEPVVKAVRKANRKAGETVARRKYVRKVQAVATPAAAPQIQGIKKMSYEFPNFFANVPAVPGADKFQSLFVEAGEKGQEVIKKGQAFAETLTEAAKANVEAVVESAKIASAGARELGQDVVAATKSNVEVASAAVKTLAEAKSPTEFFQLQSDLVRSSFDRFVAEGSKYTEQVVKLASDAVQPLSNRASINAEKFSELTA